MATNPSPRPPPYTGWGAFAVGNEIPPGGAPNGLGDGIGPTIPATTARPVASTPMPRASSNPSAPSSVE